jgi:response regulator RpfG family c-di-GMP phosphodiesterase
LNDDMMLFDDDEVVPSGPAALRPWQVLVVDDEESVHQVTHMAMADFQFDGRSIEFTDCYSAAEARAVLARPNDFALILLDVVMEHERAGLDLVRVIRDEFHNSNVRIVLRTGQPGRAPQEAVIPGYDINDYREKTDLTHAKMSEVFYLALRGYRDLMRHELDKAGLRRSISAITEVSDSQDLRSFCATLFGRVSAVLGHRSEGICASRADADGAPAPLHVLATSAGYGALSGELGPEQLPGAARALFERGMRERCSVHGASEHLYYHRTRAGHECFLYMTFDAPIGAEERELLDMFTTNVAITYEKLLQRDELQATQDAAISLLDQALARRGARAEAHALRVGELAALLAESAGMAPPEVQRLRQASRLHDIGHSVIPDAVLNTAGPMAPAQLRLMQERTSIGAEVLAGSARPVLQLAAAIAHEQHERWDGRGIPRALAGTQISLGARVTSVAAVFDSFVSAQDGAPPMSLEQAMAALQRDSGTRFDPTLVAMLAQQGPRLQQLYQRFPPT